MLLFDHLVSKRYQKVPSCINLGVWSKWFCHPLRPLCTDFFHIFCIFDFFSPFWPLCSGARQSEKRWTDVSNFFVSYFWMHNVQSFYKNIHLPIFEICVFRGYLRHHLSYKRADICKNAVSPEKSKLLEIIRHFEQFKNFLFMDLRFRDWTYIQTRFLLKNYHATSSSQTRCVCRNFVNLIFISCH